MKSTLNQWGVDLSLGLFALFAYIFGIPFLTRRVSDFIHDPENPLAQVLSLVPKDALVEINRMIVSIVPQSSRPLVESILEEIASSIHDPEIQYSNQQDDESEGRAPLADGR